MGKRQRTKRIAKAGRHLFVWDFTPGDLSSVTVYVDGCRVIDGTATHYIVIRD
jgi:hypothetical protein